MNPMVAFLTGWLAGSSQIKGSDAMKIKEVLPIRSNAFEVHFASGLILQVFIQEKEA